MDGAHGRGLGKTVTANHGRNAHGDEALGFLGNRAATVQANTKPTTGGLLDLLEDNGVDDTSAKAGEWQVAGVVHHEALCAHGAPEHVLDDRVHLADLAHDSLLDGFPDCGHTDQDGGLELGNVAAALAHGCVGDGLRVTVAHGASPVDASSFEDKFENVCKRKVCEQTIAGSKVGSDNNVNTGDSGDNVLVGEKYTLGGTSRARCEHDAAKVLGLRGDYGDGVFLALLDELAKADHSQVRVGLLELLDVGLEFLGLHLGGRRIIIVVDHVLDVFCLLERVDESGKKVRVKEHGLGVGRKQRVLEAFLAKSVVCGNNGHALAGGAVGGSEPVRVCGSVQVHAVVGLHAQGAQATTEVACASLVLAEGVVLVARQLVVLPLLLDLLLLAVDGLLDHLGLLVHLDELTLARGLCIAELLGRRADDFPDGVDAGRGDGHEAVLGAVVPPGDGLAILLHRAGHLDGERRLLDAFWLRGVGFVVHGW